MIDEDICASLGQIINKLEFRPEFYDRPFLKMKACRESRFRAYFFSVAICHQTYALKNESLKLYGWEYLEYVFTHLAENESPLLDPDFMLKAGQEKLIYLIKPLFAENHDPESCTLDRLEERTGLMLDAAAFLTKQFPGAVADLFSKEDQQLSCDEIYNRLSQMEAFADPLHKKSSFLIKLLDDAGLFHVSDPENLVPIMDYHMQRVLLRCGAVEIMDQKLRQKLQKRIVLESDEAIRAACVEAIKLIVAQTEFNSLKMNDVFYLLGRSCCLDEPLCRSGRCAKNPCSLSLAVQIGDHRHCIFENVCKAVNDDAYLSFWQPVVETHYY